MQVSIFHNKHRDMRFVKIYADSEKL